MSADQSGAAGLVAGWTGRTIAWIERAGAGWPNLGLLYGRKFYAALVRRELDLAGLAPGDSVLHVGCGSLPFTALSLARRGLSVTAVDRDPLAVRAARRFLRSRDPGCAVRVRQGEGESVDPAPFDAVWVSLHVVPRRRVLRHLLDEMRPGARLIYRNPNPGGQLERFYTHVSPEELSDGSKWAVAPGELGKQSILIDKTLRKEEPTVSHISEHSVQSSGCWLENLPAQQPAIIRSVPAEPLFAPLGLRPGKRVCVDCRHPLGGPVVVRVDGRRVALARELARRVRVADAEVAEGEWLQPQVAAARD